MDVNSPLYKLHGGRMSCSQRGYGEPICFNQSAVNVQAKNLCPPINVSQQFLLFFKGHWFSVFAQPQKLERVGNIFNQPEILEEFILSQHADLTIQQLWESSTALF